MRMYKNPDPIIYSDKIAEVINFFNQIREKNKELKQYQIVSNDQTQDILHTIELCSLTVAEQRKLMTSLSEIRRSRRVGKNEDEIVSAIMDWIKNHEKEIKSLEQLLTTVKRIEERVNGNKFYRNRTDIIKDVLGEESIIDMPKDGLQVDPSQKEELDSASDVYEEDEVEEDPQPQYITSDALKDGDITEEVTLQYPILIFHSKKKRNGMYTYAFPGLEEPLVPHVFSGGDPVLNIKNKKLLHDIKVTFNELMLKYKSKGIPEPVNVESIYPNQLKSILHLGNVTESRIIMQDYKCFKRCTKNK